MEAAGEWSSCFKGVCSEEADFMAQLLGTSTLPNAAFWGGNNGSNFKDGGEERSVSPSDEETNGSMFSFSLGNNISSICYPFVNTSMDFSMMDGKSNGVEGYDFLNQEASNDSAESDKLTQPLQEDKNSNPCEISKKRPRVFGESQRSKKLKKCVKVDENENENEDDGATNVVLHRQSSTCCSEDESNASHKANGVNSSSSSKRSGAQNSKGKARASRESATDPQSLYARKRRERINDRLKILQHLVPNGTKVDISTMLEEAVEYVKFLQVQIKLLSSDDMWMYAPIAYNGMDLGLDFKIPFPKPQS